MGLNRVIRVSLSGGIIGAIATNPRKALERSMEDANRQGWRVVQVIPDGNGNLIELLARLIILIFTLLLWTPANGYFLVLERGAASVAPEAAAAAAAVAPQWQITA